MPAFTTFLVFVMLLVDSPHDAQARFWERVLETAFGVAVAAAVVLLGHRLAQLRAPNGDIWRRCATYDRHPERARRPA